MRYEFEIIITQRRMGTIEAESMDEAQDEALTRLSEAPVVQTFDCKVELAAGM